MAIEVGKTAGLEKIIAEVATTTSATEAEKLIALIVFTIILIIFTAVCIKLVQELNKFLNTQ